MVMSAHWRRAPAVSLDAHSMIGVESALSNISRRSKPKHANRLQLIGSIVRDLKGPLLPVCDWLAKHDTKQQETYQSGDVNKNILSA